MLSVISNVTASHTLEGASPGPLPSAPHPPIAGPELQHQQDFEATLLGSGRQVYAGRVSAEQSQLAMGLIPPPPPGSRLPLHNAHNLTSTAMACHGMPGICGSIRPEWQHAFQHLSVHLSASPPIPSSLQDSHLSCAESMAALAMRQTTA